jgi:hypothetical protein
VVARPVCVWGVGGEGVCVPCGLCVYIDIICIYNIYICIYIIYIRYYICPYGVLCVSICVCRVCTYMCCICVQASSCCSRENNTYSCTSLCGTYFNEAIYIPLHLCMYCPPMHTHTHSRTHTHTYTQTHTHAYVSGMNMQRASVPIRIWSSNCC